MLDNAARAKLGKEWNRKAARYENKILLDAEAAKFTSIIRVEILFPLRRIRCFFCTHYIICDGKIDVICNK